MVLPYRLEYYGTGNTPIDITRYVESIDKFTDSGTGEIVSAKIMLDSRFGEFISEANSGTTPIISQYDVFKLEVTDDNDNTYSRFLIQDDIIPQKNESGTHVTLELFGQERYLQKMYFPGTFRFIKFRDLIIRIRNFWNANRGSSQPVLVVAATDIATMPDHAFGVFEFGSETTVYDALMDIVKRLSLPVAAGGAGRYFGLTFSGATRNQLFMRLRPQGTLPTNPLTLEKSMTVSEVKQPARANIVVVEGQPGTGSFPKEPALWRSLVEEFENIPLWSTTARYDEDAYARYENAIYRATEDHEPSDTAPDTATGWDTVKLVDYIEDQIGTRDFQYSPWTQDKHTLWKNACGNPDGSLAMNFDSVTVPDSNLVIRDATVWRDWADFRAASLSSADIPDEYLYDATADATTRQSRTYHGLRLLIDPSKGAIQEPFIGNDKYGDPYENSIVVQDRDGDWLVWRQAQHRDQCAVLHEGKVYAYIPPVTASGGLSGTRKAAVYTPPDQADPDNLAWRSVHDILYGNDCFHYPEVFENATGLLEDDPASIVTLEKTASTKFTDNSSIKIGYRFGEVSAFDSVLRFVFGGALGIIGTLARFFNDDGSTRVFDSEDGENKAHALDQYDVGWWANLFEAPYPKSTYHGIRESVGELFGGDADNKRPLLDLLNLNQTPSGLEGYGHADSDQLGPLDGIKMLFNFDVGGINTDQFRGDFVFRCAIYDLLGNVWIADTKYRLQGVKQELYFPFSSFRIYRARQPVALTLLSAYERTINPELQITEIFNRRLVKRIVLHSMFSYDDAGRYEHFSWENFIRILQLVVLGTDVTYTGTIDALHFTKTPVAIARDTAHPTNSVAHRHLATRIKKYPNISNVAQLQKIADSELTLEKFTHDTFTARYQDRADICAEDRVYIHDEDFIAETDKAGTPNTRRMIVRKVTYSVSEANDTAGLVATCELFREVTP